MIRYSLLLVFILLVSGRSAEGQEQILVEKDIQPDWLVFKEEAYAPYESNEPVRTIYFWLKPNSYRGAFLVLKSNDTFSVMLNGGLILDQRKASTISIDSLSKIFPNPSFFFAIHQEQGITQESLVTLICTKTPVGINTGETMPFKKETYFRDFAITAVLILLIFLISVFRLNPRLSSDYLSAPKIFSLRDKEDDQFYYRLTSANILFYVFTSMVIA
ncbi:MAG TPA: hypothetical protein VIY47_08650, partial [Ignavibacteriaceae bacterium]